MQWLLDDWAFPFLQLMILLFLLYVLQKDFRLKRPGSVKREKQSMGALGVTAGFAATVVTLVNMTALSGDFWLKDYSVAFNVSDVIFILYLCFKSPTCRNWIIGLHISAHTEN